MGLLRAARQPEHPLTQADTELFLLYAQEQKTSPRSLLFNGEWPQTISIAGQSSLRRLSNILQTLLHAPNIWSLLGQYLLIETSLLRDLLSNREDERNATLLADYDLLLQLARRYDAQQQARTRSAGQQEDEQGGSAATATVPTEEQVKGFLEYLTILVMLRQDGSRAGNDESEQELADVIRVMTVHASKGLEFPVVYLPGLLQRRFPAQARSSPITAPTGMLP
ncbi:MAG: ATP-dependent helicase, partial [Chloroflexi bacterium]